MLLFLLFVIVCCAVKCDDASNNYYVIEMPEEDTLKDFKAPFKVYWNVPTKQCKSKKIPFENLDKYGIIQNNNDSFQGERITIMYEPGLFPAIFKSDSGKYRLRNGGVPQEGDLEEHLTAFKKDLDQLVPDPNFNGIGIIDFESWRPIFRQNFGALVPYKDVSLTIEKKLHWWWPKAWIEAEATKRFEEAARTFMQTTLSIAKQLRPRATWGYYGFPHCFNMAANNMVENCPVNVVGENNRIYWLWSESTAIYPSVYSSRNLSSSQLGSLVRGRVKEANRVKRRGTLVLPYFWFRYRDASFITEEDLTVVLQSLYASNASGFIIWGSSNDVNTVDKCKKLLNYVETILGPTIAKYTQKIIKNDDDMPIELDGIEINNDTLLSTSDVLTTTVKATINQSKENISSDFTRIGADPEFDWIPPENYSEDISYNVEQELLKKGYNKTDDNKIDFKILNESAVMGIIIDALLNDKYDSENENIKQTTRSVPDINIFNENSEVPSDKDKLDSKNNLGFEALLNKKLISATELPKEEVANEFSVSTTTEDAENFRNIEENLQETNSEMMYTTENTFNDNSINIDVSTVNILLEQQLGNTLNKDIDDFLIIVENASHSSIETATDVIQNLVDVEDDDLIILAVNLTAPVNTMENSEDVEIINEQFKEVKTSDESSETTTSTPDISTTEYFEQEMSQNDDLHDSSMLYLSTEPDQVVTYIYSY